MMFSKAIKLEVWRLAEDLCATCGHSPGETTWNKARGVRVIAPQPAAGVDLAGLASICRRCQLNAANERARPSKTTRLRVLQRDGMACQLCDRNCLAHDELYDQDSRGCAVLRPGADKMAEAGVLLLLPRNQGGTFDLQNLVTACRGCSSSKGDRILAAWQHRQMMRFDWEETRL